METLVARCKNCGKMLFQEPEPSLYKYYHEDTKNAYCRAPSESQYWTKELGEKDEAYEVIKILVLYD